jgi:ATP-binding cassette subfamily C (CFTR/MRP) protein 1
MDKTPEPAQESVKLKMNTPPHKYVNVCLEDKANPISKLFFLWTNKMINYGRKNAFQEDDLFEIRKDQKFAYSRDSFANHYNKKGAKSYKSVGRSMLAVIRTPLFVASLLLIISNLLQFAGPLLLKEILKYLAMPTIPDWKGWVYASGMFAAFLIKAIMNQQGMHHVISMSLKNLVSPQSAIFEKILNIKATARGYVDTGKIVNLATVDCLGIFRFSTMASYVITAPFIIVAAMALIINEVGASGVVGLGVIVVGTFITGIANVKTVGIRFASLRFSDQRSKAIAEYISGIRVIKYYGWENFAFKKINEIRQNETYQLFRLAIWRAIQNFFASLVPLSISVSVFGVYVATGHELTPTKAFTTLALFNLVQMPVVMLSFSLLFYANTVVSLKRIQHFSDWENHEPIPEDKSLEVGTVAIKNGNFAWDNEVTHKHGALMATVFQPRGGPGGPPGKGKQGKGKPQGKPQAKPEAKKALETEPGSADTQRHLSLSRTHTETGTLLRADSKPEAKKIDNILHDINFTIKAGEMVGVIGQVGSGKSSLVNAMIGEMHKVSGEVSYKGRVAYIPQQAWLRNATLKENILFGEPLNEQRYKHVLDICELSDDIAMLPGGDMTEIGERGINLSGGQKQRVSIARAIYSNADIYIIDDCLSALDAYVGRKIYENVLKGELKTKTIIFVTHALHYVTEADRVAVMKDGRIVEMDAPSALQADPASEYNRLTVNTKHAEADDEKKEEDGKKEKKKSTTIEKKQEGEKKITPAGNEEEMKKKGELAGNEERATGSVPWRVYRDYIVSGGAFYSSLLAVFFLIYQGFAQVTSWWLSIWSNGSYNLSSGNYILIYALLSLGTSVCALARGFVFGMFTRQTSLTLFAKQLYAIFRSPMSWFDVTPSGRILNRTSKDQDDVDSNLPFTIQMSLQNFLTLIGTIISIGVVNPPFFAFAFVAVLYCLYVIKVYLQASRELKRVERISLAPTLSLFSECANGYQVIRAFKKENHFREMFEQRFDKYLKAAAGGANLERWVALRTDLFGAFIVGATCYFSVGTRDDYKPGDAGLAGLSISWSLTITGLVSFALKTLSDTEIQMNSVERILQYINKTEKEAEWETPEAPQGWPKAGNWEAENITYRYRDGLPNVIHGINFSIQSREKIGVVGRTGSGKSTLTLGLLRILELAEQDGKVGKLSLDGTVVGNIGLHELRKKITIIPQDPVLFTGDVRSNVDPFNEYPDEAIIDALKKVQVWDQIKGNTSNPAGMPPGLLGKRSGGKKKAMQPAAVEMTPLTDDQKKLKMNINDGGSNFSLGQRQLICMARALVRKPKVLLMDEATASIDELTDHLIQKMIKTEFKETTVITIAHRLNTIIQYDKILVLDQGNIAEFEDPVNLLESGGYFSNLIKENGPDFESKMKYLARNKNIDADQLSPIKAVGSSDSDNEGTPTNGIVSLKDVTPDTKKNN